MNMLETGAAWLALQLKTHAGKAIEYRRGEQKAALVATLGKSAFMVERTGGLFERIESRDYLIAPADLDFGLGPVLPAKGDVVAELIGAGVYLYEVFSPGNEPPYKFCDPGRNFLRVHTKFLEQENP